MQHETGADELSRLQARFGKDIWGARRAAGRADWDHLAQAVRRARQAEGISQSELARRAGISPSVISRIESGVVRSPDERTLSRLATALGRSMTVLDLIVRGATTEAADEIDIPVLREAKAAMRDEFEKEIVDDAAIEWEWEPAVMDALVEHFVSTKGLDDLHTDHLDADTRWAVERIALWWPGLTDHRKELALEYIHDQWLLSIGPLPDLPDLGPAGPAAPRRADSNGS